jgi:hypothetical protein
MAMHQEMPVMGPRQQQPTLHLLDGSEEPGTATRRLFSDPTGDILREHGPSLGNTPHSIGEFEPVILTSSVTCQRERIFG